MLVRLRIINFQSLADVTLTLGRFTVVTGETGAGKSAVVRALHALAFNVSGTSHIRQGENYSRIVLQDDLGMGVALQRSQRPDANAYVLSLLGEKKTYTKLGGKVPEEVTSALALGPVNFAAQFDRPYLLDESGHRIARTLGKLTNVTLVMEAAREGTRRLRRLQDQAKLRDADVARLRVAIEPYADLRQRHEALAATETAFEAVKDLAAVLVTLQQRTAELEAALEASRAIQAARREVPDVTALANAWARLSGLRSLLRLIDDERRKAGQYRQAAAGWERTVAERERELHDLLAEAGRCPTCGQEIRPADGDAA